MAISLRLTPNAPEGGDRLKLSLEGVRNPAQVRGKLCTVKVWELDKNTTRDLLATFEATIVQTTVLGSPPVFTFDGIRRTDNNPHSLPPLDEKKTTIDRKGKPIVVPQFLPPYFLLELAGLELGFPILITKREREEYIYELGVEISVGGKRIRTPRKHPTLLDCSNFLSHNCIQWARLMKDTHEELVKRHGIGKYYGTQFESSLDDWLNNRLLKGMLIDKVNKTKTALHKHINDHGLTATDCYKFQLSVGELGHQATLAEADWAKIIKKAGGTKKVKNSGQSLFLGLQAYGWKGIYFNMDTKNPKDRDYANDPRPDPNKLFKHHHSITWKRAKKYRKYGIKGWELEVDDLLTNYRPTTQFDDGEIVDAADVTKPTAIEKEKLEQLKKVPFGFVLTRYGKHTTLIIEGKIVEVHWNGTPWAHRSAHILAEYDENQVLFRESDFATEWNYQSGMIMVPQRYWPSPKAKVTQDKK